jgi:hypothetical protein
MKRALWTLGLAAALPVSVKPIWALGQDTARPPSANAYYLEVSNHGEVPNLRASVEQARGSVANLANLAREPLGIGAGKVGQ